MAVVSIVDPDSPAIPHKWGVLFGFAWETTTIWFSRRKMSPSGVQWQDCKGASPAPTTGGIDTLAGSGSADTEPA